MSRLSLDTVSGLPAAVSRPGHDPRALGIGIVHLGLGAFHRAHQAVYTDRAVALHGGAWGICGVSLRHPDTPDRLAPQDGLYTVVERAGEGDRMQVVGAVREVLFAPARRDALLARLVDPATRVVSLTITEKGYWRDPASGALMDTAPEVAADLAQREAPGTALGWLALALAHRRRAGIAPFAVMSCDNLPRNGASLRRVLLDFVAGGDDALAGWVESEVAFPGTMVDRIVPATTPDVLEAVRAATGLDDAAPVVTEPFSQWVIEDWFPGGRPAWEHAGAIVTGDVDVYETMKLRLLNGAHSTLAYLGQLAGRETVAECMRDPPLRDFVERLMRDEIAPSLAPPPGFDVSGYVDTLLARFTNPSLEHRTGQIAMDGSQKLPQRLLATLQHRLERGEHVARLSLAVAAWMRFVCGVDGDGREHAVDDPHAARLAAIGREALARPGAERAGALVDGLLAFEPVFGGDGGQREALRAPVTSAMEVLLGEGIRGALERPTR